MDPNVTLASIRATVELLDSAELTDCELIEEAATLAELVTLLDEWITRGGFLPTSWACPTVPPCGVPAVATVTCDVCNGTGTLQRDADEVIV